METFTQSDNINIVYVQKKKVINFAPWENLINLCLKFRNYVMGEYDVLKFASQIE